ncbi:hypothetical protein [Chromobacterium amazonense]|nr:hypothetical protein [Chromobacterium amazonense]
MAELNKLMQKMLHHGSCFFWECAAMLGAAAAMISAFHAFVMLMGGRAFLPNALKRSAFD